jgi:ABC-2 type transport system permease protein
MNTESNAVTGSPLESRADAPAVISETRRLYWAVRREVWENRSLYVAPLGASAVFLFGFVISTLHLPSRMRASGQDGDYLYEFMLQSCGFAALVLMGTLILVAAFYCLDALHSERRDRSILFWKSLPISDLTTVLSKALVAVVLLPLFAFVLTCALWFVMVSFSSVVLLARGTSVATISSQLNIFQLLPAVLYHLLGIHGFWYAPIYGWLLLVSSWARRAPFLWATLPPLAIGVVEKIAFRTSYFAGMLSQVFGVGMDDGMHSKATGMLGVLVPHLGVGEFLTSPSLWIGLAVTAIFLAAAVRMRRSQGPI